MINFFLEFRIEFCNFNLKWINYYMSKWNHSISLLISFKLLFDWPVIIQLLFEHTDTAKVWKRMLYIMINEVRSVKNNIADAKIFYYIDFRFWYYRIALKGTLKVPVFRVILVRISSHSNQNNSGYWHLLRSDWFNRIKFVEGGHRRILMLIFLVLIVPSLKTIT